MELPRFTFFKKPALKKYAFCSLKIKQLVIFQAYFECCGMLANASLALMRDLCRRLA